MNLVTDSNTRGFDGDYDFFGRDPVEWHEELRWLVWFTTPVASWDEARMRAVAAAIGPTSRADGFVSRPVVTFDGAWALITAEVERDAAKARPAFDAMARALDEVHGVVPLQRVFVVGVEQVSDAERAHWARVDRLPDWGDGPIAIDDWGAEGALAENGHAPKTSPAFDEALAAWAGQHQDAGAGLRLVSVAPPAFLAWDAQAAALRLRPYVPTTRGGMGHRFEAEPTPERPLATIPQEIVLEVEGEVRTFTRPNNDRLLFAAPSPSGRRGFYSSTLPGAARCILEVSHADGACTVAFRGAPPQVSPNHEVVRAAYLDTDDWAVVRTNNNSGPKRVSSLELHKRVATGFVRTDDLACKAATIATSGRFIVTLENDQVTVLARVGSTLQEVGTVRVPPGAPDVLRAGPDGSFWITDNARTTCLALEGHVAMLAALPAVEAQPGALRLVAVAMNDVLFDAPGALPANCRETQSGPGHYWARGPASVVVWRGNEHREFEPPASVYYPTMSVHPDGARALFGLTGDQCAELDAATGAWRVLRTEPGRPFYLRVDGVELVAFAQPTGLRVFRGDELEPVASLAQAATDHGSTAVVTADGHLHELVSDGGPFRFVDRGPLVAPGRRLEGAGIEGRTENGLGFAFVATGRGIGEYCTLDA